MMISPADLKAKEVQCLSAEDLSSLIFSKAKILGETNILLKMSL